MQVVLLSLLGAVMLTGAFIIPPTPGHKSSSGVPIRVAEMAAMSDAGVEAAALQLLVDLKAGKVAMADLLGPLHGPRSGLTTGGAPPPPTPQPQVNAADFAAAEEAPALPAEDKFNKALVANVHPPDYINPTPSDCYDLVVIGAGVSGLLSVIMAKGLGMRCALVERHYMGGDCLNVGCVPSKALIACARRVHDVRSAAPFGVRLRVDAVEVDFPAIMERMRAIRAEISAADGVARYARDFCEHVFLGQATFSGAHSVTVGGGAAGDRVLRFRKAMIATGGSAAVPPALRSGGGGSGGVPYLSNANFFNLEELPPRLCVVGAGPIGLELAQSMARLGSRVTCLERGVRIMGREDEDAAAVVRASMERDGVTFVTSASLQRVELLHSGALYRRPFHRYRVSYSTTASGSGAGSGALLGLECDAVLVAAGRVPNVLGLGLEAAGVQYDARRGVIVDETFRTTALSGDVYACGDCASPYKFTHAADWQARAAVRNMFLGTRERLADLMIPWATYTDPEVAHVGLYESDLRARGVAFETYTRQLADVDRCRCEGVAEGFVKLLVAADDDKWGEGGGGGQILGATIVAERAGDMISEVSVAMQCGVGAGQLAGVIHPYPTTQEAVRQAAAQYNKRYRTPAVNRALQLLLDQRRMREDSSEWWAEVLSSAVATAAAAKQKG